MKQSLTIMVALLLSACATNHSLNELKQVSPTGTEYQKELAALYLFFAEEEAEAFDWSDSQYFADKGLSAAYGHDVEPENAGNWDIAEGKVDELNVAKNLLEEYLNQDMMEQHPEALARSVFFYDCWVEQQEEAWQEDDISSCRESFFSAMQLLKETKVSVVEEPEVELVEAETLNTTTYMVFFELGSAKLSKDGMKIVRSIAADVENLASYDVLVNGHADRSGDADKNLELALKRAESVKKELIALGVTESVIHSFSFGESDSRVETENGKAEAANRRVEIFVTSE